MSDVSEPVPGEDELCKQCGHLFNPHRLLGHGDPPTEGWMECPVEGCTCKMTWSMDPKAPEHIKNIFEIGSEEGDAPLLADHSRRLSPGDLVKKPAVIWIVQIYVVWFALGAGMGTLALVGVLNGGLSIAQGGGTFLVGIGSLAGAVTLLVKMSRRQITRRSVVLFLWFVLALYPITNILGHVGFYFPKSIVSDDQLAGASFAEILRYLMPIALILWLSFSKQSAQYLLAWTGSNNSPQDGARNARA